MSESSAEREQEAMDVEVPENYFIHPSFLSHIDGEISNMEEEIRIAVANEIEVYTLSTGTMTTCDLNINVALHKTFQDRCFQSRDGEETSSGTSYHVYRTENRLLADTAEITARDAGLIAGNGNELIENILTAIDDLRSNISGFSHKDVEAFKRGTERDLRISQFYHDMTSKYNDIIDDLELRRKDIRAALIRVNEAAIECQRHANIVRKITDDEVNRSVRLLIDASIRINKLKAAIIIALRKQHSALRKLIRMCKVRDDMKHEEQIVSGGSDEQPASGGSDEQPASGGSDEQPASGGSDEQPASGESDEQTFSVESDEETQQCQNREWKTKIAHIVATLFGISLLSITSLFKVGSSSFITILFLGLLITGWCIIYWGHKLYPCLKELYNKRVTTETATPEATTETQATTETSSQATPEASTETSTETSTENEASTETSQATTVEQEGYERRLSDVKSSLSKYKSHAIVDSESD